MRYDGIGNTPTSPRAYRTSCRRKSTKPVLRSPSMTHFPLSFSIGNDSILCQFKNSPLTGRTLSSIMLPLLPIESQGLCLPPIVCPGLVTELFRSGARVWSVCDHRGLTLFPQGVLIPAGYWGNLAIAYRSIRSFGRAVCAQHSRGLFFLLAVINGTTRHVDNYWRAAVHIWICRYRSGPVSFPLSDK